jgi:hypothetical protein
VCIARDLGWQPIGLCVGSDEDEKATAVMPAYSFGRIVPDVDRGQMAVAVYRLDFRAQQDRYVRFSAQLLDQVVRHALLQGVAPDDECHFAGIVGKVQCRLPGGVAGTNQEDVEPVYCACLAARRPKVNAFAKEPVKALDLEVAPSDARTDRLHLYPPGGVAGRPHHRFLS